MEKQPEKRGSWLVSLCKMMYVEDKILAGMDLGLISVVLHAVYTALNQVGFL